MSKDNLQLDTCVRRNPELVAVEMDGETVMMDVNTGHYFGLDAVGGLVWTLLEDECSIEAIAASVRESFDVDADADVEGDMLTFVTDLRSSGLVHIVASE